MDSFPVRSAVRFAGDIATVAAVAPETACDGELAAADADDRVLGT